jgi:hypothetical protein
MVQFLSIIFFIRFLQFLLGFSKVPIFLCHPVHISAKSFAAINVYQVTLVMSADMYGGICVKLSLEQAYVNENLSEPTRC